MQQYQETPRHPFHDRQGLPHGPPPHMQKKKKREKPFQTSKRPGKGSKAEATAALKAKYGHLKGGVWEPEEEEELLRTLEEGLTDIYKLGEKFNRTHRVVRRKLKRIAMARAEESQDPESAAAFTGLEVDGLKKMLANKVKREKKKAEKAKNKTLPPKDQVVELLTALNEKLDLICRVVLGPSAQAVLSAPVPQGDLLLDFHTSLATTDSSVTVQGDETGRADIEPLSLS